MNKTQRLVLFFLRISMGWLFLYAGIVKVINPQWSAAGFLSGAKTFPGLFNWFLQPGVLPFTNFVNEWGLTLLGISLILGAFARWSSLLGALLMILYYLPALDFPYIGVNSFIVDEHIIYAFVLLFFATVGAGKFWGLDGKLFKRSH
ncbi:MAG: DoxX family protein [Candidatus Paceibacterota bacterium]